MSIQNGQAIDAKDFVFEAEAGEDLGAGDAVFIANGENKKSVGEYAGSATAGSGSRAGVTIIVPEGATRLNAFAFITGFVQNGTVNCNVRRNSFADAVLDSWSFQGGATGGIINARGALDIAVTPGETLYFDFSGPGNARGNSAAGECNDMTSYFYDGTTWELESVFQYAAAAQFDFGVAGLTYRAYAQTHLGNSSGFSSGSPSSVDTVEKIAGFAITGALKGAQAKILTLPIITNLSGLSGGERYYLKDITNLADSGDNGGGDLSTTQSSESPLIGQSVSATQLVRTP